MKGTEVRRRSEKVERSKEEEEINQRGLLSNVKIEKGRDREIQGTRTDNKTGLFSDLKMENVKGREVRKRKERVERYKEQEQIKQRGSVNDVDRDEEINRPEEEVADEVKVNVD